MLPPQKLKTAENVEGGIMKMFFLGNNYIFLRKMHHTNIHVYVQQFSMAFNFHRYFIFCREIEDFIFYGFDFYCLMRPSIFHIEMCVQGP